MIMKTREFSYEVYDIKSGKTLFAQTCRIPAFFTNDQLSAMLKDWVALEFGKKASFAFSK